MTTLHVKKIINSREADTYDKSDSLHAVILENLKKNEISILDFTGIISVTSSFFNRSIASFYFTSDPETLRKLIKIKSNSLEPYQMLKLERSLRNAKAKIGGTVSNETKY